MQAQDFLVELGTEELPPKALKQLAEAVLAGVEKGLRCRPGLSVRPLLRSTPASGGVG